MSTLLFTHGAAHVAAIWTAHTSAYYAAHGTAKCSTKLLTYWATY